MFIASLIAKPGQLDPALVENLRNALGGGSAYWLSPDEAAEFPLETVPAHLEDIRASIIDRADLNLLPAEGRRLARAGGGQRDALHAGGERGVRLARRQRPAEGFDSSLVGHVMTEQYVHQGRLAGSVLAEQRDHLAALQLEGYGIVRRQRPETLCDVGEAKNGLRLSAPL